MAKQLRTDIIIGGKADQSLFGLGNDLQTIGNYVNRVSDKVIEFGKESVNAFVSYEDQMLNAEAALKTQYTAASELAKVMQSLDKAALKWASDSRFTTADVAQGISEATHAGWDLQKIMNGIPAAMNISLAGSMTLAEGLEYLIDISNAAGIEFENLSDFTDVWAYAANKSSTQISEMGQAMQKMGATMRFFKGDYAQMATMLGVLADNGAKGTEAGTLLRNSMIRLVAPTKAAASAMDELMLTDADIEEIYGDDSGLQNAIDLLKAAGFSAYDAEGNLKSFLDTFRDLNAATKGMTEEERNSVLSSIFPTRTITGALALLNAADNGWNGLYENIRSNGNGYADYVAETMESGLGGTLRHLSSVYNAVQTRTGSAVSDDVATVAGGISGMLESINSMDDGKFQMLVTGMEVVAASGPALVAAGPLDV